MARLPTVGDDTGQWGTILNQFLLVSFNPDGTLIVKPFTNPMSGAGDMITGGPAGIAQRLAIGPNGNFLGVQNGVPVWLPVPSGFANPMTTLGDLIVGIAGGAAQRLGVGVAGQVLGITGGAPAWVTNPAGFTNPMTTLGDIITALAGGTAQRLAIGANGQVLSVVAGAPAWAASPAGFANPMTALGDIITALSGGTAQRLAVGTNGQVLTVVSGSPAWSSAAAQYLLTPSGDITGVSDLNAIQSQLNGVHNCILAPGTWYLPSTSTQFPNGLRLNYGDVLRGSGWGNTIINAVGSGTFIYAHGGNAPYPYNQPAAQISDFTLDMSAVTAVSTGIDFGDGSNYRIERVRVAAATVASCPTGTIFFNEINRFGWTEKQIVDVSVYNSPYNTPGYVIDKTGAGVSPPKWSHMYSEHRIHLNINADANGAGSGVQFKNGAFMQNAHGGGGLNIYGNFYPAGYNPVPPNLPYCLDISGSDGAGDFCHIGTMPVHVGVETTGAGNTTWQTIKFGSNANNHMHGDWGGLVFIGANWGVSDISNTLGQLTFGGYINGDAQLIANRTAPAGWV